MNIKKFTRNIIPAIMTVIITVASSSPTLVLAADESNIYGDYLIETVISNDNGYTKQKITNTKTNEIEWLESYFNEDGTSYSIAESDTQQYTIENDGTEVIVSLDNEIIQTIQTIDLAEIKEEIQPAATGGVLSRAYGSWSSPTFRYSSRSIRVTIASAAIAVIASILGVPASYSIAITAGTTMFSLGLKDVYYIVERSYRFDLSKELYEGRDKTSIYKVSNYTGYLGSNTQYWTGSATN